MAILSALGAECTLLELSAEQLAADRMVSEREGYPIELVQRDMTQPLPFAEDTFDYVVNPVSNQYIQEIEPVFREMYRVLKKGGVFLGGFDTGFNFVVDDSETTISRGLPYDPLADEELYNELMEGDYGLQFSHTAAQQLQGQLSAGFVLRELYEDYNPGGNLAEKKIPTFLATRAVK